MLQDSAFQTRESAGRFVFLDALRGLAAVAVVFFHFNNQWVSPVYQQFSALLPHWLLGVWNHLDLGVEVFFVLSGFVIAHSLANQTVDLRYAGNFLLRRMIRLAPPYWVMIAILMGAPYLFYPTLIDGFFERFGGWRGILVNMFYLPDIVGPYRIVPVAWTLCLEVQFYLALLGFYLYGHMMQRAAAKAVMLEYSEGSGSIERPLPIDRARPFGVPQGDGLGPNAEVAVESRPRLLSVLVALPFVILTLASLVCWFTMPHNVFLDRWWMFAAGVLVYTMMRGRWFGWPIALSIALAVVGAVLREPRSIATALTCTAILVAARSNGLGTWLNWAPLQYFGRISYSLYLVHMAFGVAAIGLAMRVADGSPVSIVTAVVAGILTSIVAADLMHRFIEAPSARLASRLRLKPRPAVTQPTPAPIVDTPTPDGLVVT